RRAHLPAARAIDRGDRAGAQRSRAPRQALLPASAGRQGRADPREAGPDGPRNGGEARGVRGPRPTLEREIAFWRAGGGVVAGVDEAGRGPLAGPVVAAAVVFPPHCKFIRGLRDSKLLPPAKRSRLALVVRARALAIGVGAASVREIDRLNIRRASILAMERALARLALTPDLVLVDGLPCPELGQWLGVEDVARLEPRAAREIDRVLHERQVARLVAVRREDEPDALLFAGRREGVREVHALGVAVQLEQAPRRRAGATQRVE